MALNRQFIIGATTSAITVLLTTLTMAQSGVARPSIQPSEPLLSQVNRPENEGIPALNTEEVRGKVTKVEGDKVELRLASGELRTYSIPAEDQERNGLAVGSEVVLTVRGDTVVAIAPGAATGASGTVQSGGTSSSGSVRSGSASSSTSSSSSSTTVIRRQTTVQQTAPAPAPAAQPQPQPVRGLW